MKKIFLCGLILFCNSAFADGCENTLFLIKGCVDVPANNYCNYCTSDESDCAEQTMDENDTATLPSEPSGGDKYCCVKDNEVYVYNSWNIRDNQGFDYSYGTKGFGEKITVKLNDGYFALPATEKADNQNGLCKGGVYKPCPANMKCENGVEEICPNGKYCENGVDYECPNGHFCEGGQKQSCPEGYYCTNGVMTRCRETRYCPAGSLSEKECPKGSKCVGGVAIECNTPGYYCEGGTERQCPAGFYCTGDGFEQACPAPQKSDDGAIAKTDCFIDSGTRFCDDANECFYLNNIDKKNTKIFIKN